MARVAIEMDLWKKTRIEAMETGVTAASIVNAALREFFDRKANGSSVAVEDEAFTTFKSSLEKKVANVFDVPAEVIGAAENDPWQDLSKTSSRSESTGSSPDSASGSVTEDSVSERSNGVLAGKVIQNPADVAKIVPMQPLRAVPKPGAKPRRR